MLDKYVVRPLLAFITIALIGCSAEKGDNQAYVDAKIAVVDGELERLKTVVAQDGAVVGEVDPWDSSTLLHAACATSVDEEIVGYLLEVGADVNALDDEGRTPLHNAYIFSAGNAVLKVLLDAGADESIKDSYEKVPVEYKKVFEST